MSPLMRTLGSLTLGGVLCASPATGQTEPDFSGRWELVDPPDATPGVARTLVVQQPVVRTNVRGEPIPPGFLNITIERHFLAETRVETHRIGVQGGVVGGLASGGAPGVAAPRTTFSVRWNGRRLVMQSANYSGLTPESSPDTDRTETWQLDPTGSLRVTLVIRESGRNTTELVALYRRN